MSQDTSTKPIHYENSVFSIYERHDSATVNVNIPLRFDGLHIREFEEYEEAIQEYLTMFTNRIFKHILFITETAEEKDLHSLEIAGILDFLSTVGLGLSEAKELVRMNFEKAKAEVSQ